LHSLAWHRITMFAVVPATRSVVAEREENLVMRFGPLLVVLLGVAASSSLAQPVPPGANPVTGARPGNDIGTGASLPMSDKASNIAPGDTSSPIAPNLPSPAIGENATPRDYLVAARAALVQGKTGEAQQALEMAESRALDRSVPLFQTSTPDANPLIGQITQALNALGAGDRGRAVQIIEAAMAHAGP
jgi:hypothetical protein